MHMISGVILTAVVLFQCSAGKSSTTTAKSDIPLIKLVNTTQSAIVRFSLTTNDTEVKSVKVIGDFNNWKTNDLPMVYFNGSWQIDVELGYGIYQYKFLINQTNIIIDPNAEAFVPDSSGGKNGIIEVKRIEK